MPSSLKREGCPGEPLRVLQVDTAISWRGGEAQVLLLSRGLKSRGHQVGIVAQPGSQLAERARSEGLSVYPLRMRGEGDLWAAFQLGRLIRRFQPHILHLHTSHAHTLGCVAAKLSPGPKLVVSRRVDFHLRRSPFKGFKYGSGVKRYLAVSRRIRDVLIEDGVEPRKVEVVYDGLDLTHLKMGDGDEWRRKFGLGPDGFLVGNVASLAPHKGQTYLLQAAKEVLGSFPEVRFVIVGEGELEGKLKREIKALSLQGKVILTGFQRDIAPLYAALDLFVLSSYLEGLCTSLLEAMFYGVPIVATRTGGIPEIVRDGVNGWLVPPRDAEALAKAIKGLLIDRELARRFSTQGKIMVRKFRIEETVRKTEEAYQKVLKE